MKKLFAVGILAGMLAVLCGCGEKTESRTVFAMDTVMEFSVFGRQADSALAAMEERVQQLDALLSRTRKNSEVTALNNAKGAETAVSQETFSLLQAAKTLSDETGHAFDVTIAPVASAWGFTESSYRVPETEELQRLLETVDSSAITLRAQDGAYFAQLGTEQTVDLGGIAKGYASDCMADILLENGISGGYAALGGNILAWGSKSDGSAWRVGIKDPNQTDALVGILELKDAYAVTSGGYERYFEQDGVTYHHIIDPASGYPANSDLVSVTVIMDRSETMLNGATGNGTVCDALSTALFVMGETAAVELWRESGGAFDAVLVTADGRVVSTAGIAAQFIPTDGSGYVYETVS